jgi:hypothetical protein
MSVAEHRGRLLPTEIIWGPPTWALLIGYLLGSIPFGIILTRAAGAGDLRSIGSGNIGATNVLRTGRKGLAAATGCPARKRWQRQRHSSVIAIPSG